MRGFRPEDQVRPLQFQSANSYETFGISRTGAGTCRDLQGLAGIKVAHVSTGPDLRSPYFSLGILRSPRIRILICSGAQFEFDIG